MARQDPGATQPTERTTDLLLTKYLRAGISYQGLQRIEAFPVPEAALREAVINAIAHKDYASAIPIQISVYHDKLMIWNAGALPHDWTLDRLTAKHASSPSNPDIANAFFRVAFMESWGRGIDLIRNACRASKLPEPVFRWDNGLWVEFPFSQATGAPPDAAARRESPAATQKTTQKTTQKILQMLLQDPSLSRRQIAAALGDVSENGVKYHLQRLKASGHIRRAGPDKGGHWDVLT